MKLQKKKQIYAGKAKSLYETNDPQYLIMEFRDDATAFNGIKKAKLANKGAVNNQFNAFIMQRLEAQGIATQFVALFSPTESIVKHLNMIPVESVIRNVVAGNLAKRLGMEEGRALSSPILEFFLKSDALNDPMINDSIIRAFEWATEEEIQQMQAQTIKINHFLNALFSEAGLLLVDFKLEFGRCDGKIVLGDEFTPDGCRIWDIKTQEKLDKDRFRRDLGGVIEGYEQVADRLGMRLII